MGTTLAEILKQHLSRRGWSFKRLAKEAGLVSSTVHRWTSGEVTRVRHWQDLAKAAKALDLNRAQTNALLAAGGHPAIDVLLERATDEGDRELLARWARSTPNNLPALLTSFVGREEELDLLTQLLSSARLVTLTGPGGSGKTRLAIEASQAVLDEFEEVCFVDLAAVRDPGLVIATISQTLGLKESLEDPALHALKTDLRDRTMLLVLDNFEQVIEAAPLVTELLEAAPDVKMLVTSRSRLNVRGEHQLEVPPLPPPDLSLHVDELARNPAVVLFAERARAVNHAFALTPGDTPLVADVCARLEGLPLGIELVAAKTRHVRLRSMAARFPSRLALASAGPRDAPDRHRTLRATIAWSHDLLGDEEQALFNRLAVFAGSFAEEAAASVCRATGRLKIDVPEGLESLVEQNLLRRVWDDADESRFEMLETIREYALERLHERGEAEATRAAATAFYLELAEQGDLEGSGQAFWLPRLIPEHDNFRASLSWCRERGQMETGLRLCIALMPLWQLRDHHLEARTWLEAFMVDDVEASPSLRARGLLWRGLLLMRGTGDDLAASHFFAQALVLFRDGGDLDGASETLQAEGDVYRNQEKLALASQRYTESVDLAGRAGNAYLVAHGHFGLALCAQEEGKLEAAQHEWELMLEWAEKSGNDMSVALAMNSLGEMARHRREWEEAERYYQRTLTLARKLGNESRMALAQHNLGYVALYRGEPGNALALFAGSLSLYEGRHYHKGVAECLAGLGKVEASIGRPEKAARLCGAAEAILERLGTRLDSLDRIDYDLTLAVLRNQLGEGLETLLDEGRAMPMEDAVNYAAPDAGTVDHLMRTSREV